MHFERKSFFAPAVILLAGLFLLASCTQEESYDTSKHPVDTSVTVFGDGLTVPIGSTDKISLGDLINSAGEGINDYVKTGKNGELALTYSGNTSLTERIAELDLAGMASIDGISFSDDFSYHVGNFNSDSFTINGDYYDLKVKFEGIDLVNVIPLNETTFVEGLEFHAGLDDYKDVIKDNKDLDLASNIGNIIYNQDVLTKAEMVDALAPYPEGIEVPVPETVSPHIQLPDREVALKVDPIKLDDNVTALTNIKTNPNAKLVVSLKMTDVSFTGGKMVPDVELDFTKLLRIKGGSLLSLKDMVLTKDNGWACIKSFDVEGLVKTGYEEVFTLDGVIPVKGDVYISDGVTTKEHVAQTVGDMFLSIDVHFVDFTIDNADLAIHSDPFDLSDTIELGEIEDSVLPRSIDDVKVVYMDESKPLTFKVTPSNLDRLKQKNLLYTFTLSFPSSIKVKDAVNGKLTFDGDLAGGSFEKKIVIQELYPTVSGNKITLDAKVKVNARVEPKNLVLNSSKLPQNKEEDLSFAVTVNGKPEISDYRITLGDYEEPAQLNGNVELNANGIRGFSGMHVKPEGKPALTIKCDIPTVKGITLSPGKEGFKICLPAFVIFDASGIDSAYGFNAADNSITLKGSFPKQITMPIKEFYIKPVTVGGKTVIRGSYSASGNVSIPSTDVFQKDLEETFGSDIGITINVPDIKAAEVSLDENLSFDIDQKFNLIIKNIPEQLKRIDEILLDDVYLNLDAAFTGLPSSGETPFMVDMTITLPEFISPSSIPLKGPIKDGKLAINPVKIVKLYNFENNAEGTVEGQIGFSGAITADGAKINLAELKPDISGKLEVSLKNKAGKISIASAKGMFSYDVEQSTSFDLSDLPDILKKEGVTLDLADPQISFDITTNIGIPLGADLEIVPFRGGSALNSSALIFKDVKLPHTSSAAQTTTKGFCVCKSASSAPSGKEFLQADISNLLKNLPDSLQIKIKASVDGTVTSIVEPSAKYVLDVDYGINVPLAFGSDFVFTTDTELDLAGAASIVSMGDFGIKGKVLNDSPLNLSVAMDLLDPSGNVIPQTKSSVIDIKGQSTSDVEFYLSPADKSKTVSKARLTVRVTAIPNVVVKDTDCLQFLDLVAVAPEGITVNTNK